MALRNRQDGLSLFWCAVLAGVVSIAAIGALFSMRYERNFFAEAWMRMTRTLPGREALRAADDAVKSASAAVRKCIVDGKVMYSNVECDAGNPTSRKVDLHDTRGIEAPKAPPAAPETGAVPDFTEQTSGTAIQR